MTLEELIKENTAAMRELTAALKAGALPIYPPIGEDNASTAKELNTDPNVSTAEANRLDAEANAAPAVPAGDTKKNLLAFSQRHGKKAAVEILNKFGANKLSDLSEDKWPALDAEFKKYDAAFEAAL